MSRHNSSSSYGHRCTEERPGEFVIAWTVDRYYAGSRLRHPQRMVRDTDRRGAERFAKRWAISIQWYEAPLLCGPCGHPTSPCRDPGRLRRPCRTTACECRCNR